MNERRKHNNPFYRDQARSRGEHAAADGCLVCAPNSVERRYVDTPQGIRVHDDNAKPAKAIEGGPACEVIEPYDISKLSDILAWLRERYDNCMRIVAQKSGNDKIGWLVDASYFHGAIDILDTLETERQRAQPWGQWVLMKQRAEAAESKVAELEAALRWIPVSEKFPPFGKWVHVVCHGVVQQQAARYFREEVWGWADRDADQAPKDAITHWLPLLAAPVAPKEG